jgi:membrane protein
MSDDPSPPQPAKGRHGTLARYRATFDDILKLFALAGRGFLRDEGLYRASALAFDTVLGLVPFLAFLVSALKGFGAYQALMRELIRPGIVSTMMSMGAQQNKQGVGLLSVFLKVLDIVEQASFGTIGVFGLFFLLYIVVLLLVSIEETMNHIFGVERSRSVARRLADYSAILFITPVFMILTAGVLTGFEKSTFVQGDMPWQVLAALIMVVGLTSLYWVMPHRRVRLRSAAIGGVVAGVSWYLVLSLHVHFQIGVARYNALYSTFAAIPLFLVWLFISWIVVLFGAELAAAHDNTMQHAWRIQGESVDHASRLFVALSGLCAVAQRHLAAGAPLTLSNIAARLSLPEPLIRNELRVFVQAELLTASERGGEPVYTLARDVDAVHLGELLRLLEQTWASVPFLTECDRRLKGLLEERVLARDAATADLTLRELVKYWQGTDASIPH